MRSSRREVAELNASSIELPELPPTWTVCRLGDVASLQPGYAFKSSWFEPEGVRLLRGINIEPNRVRWEDVVCLAPERARDFDVYELQVNDVVIAMDRPIISSGLKVTMLSGQDVPSLLLQRVGRFKVTQALDRGYLFRFLNSTTFVVHIGGQATGTQIPHISGTDIETAPFPLPPLAEQRRVVAKVEALTAKSRRAKEALDAIPALLERFRESVLAAAFRGDLTADWREKNPDVEPAEELLKRIRAERRRRWEEAELAKMRAKGKVPGDDRWKEKYKEPAPVDATDLPELPEGWCWAGLEYLLAEELSNGRSVPTDEDGFPVLRLTALHSSIVDLGKRKRGAWTQAEAAPFLVRRGDIFVSRGNGSLDLVGRGSYVASDPDPVAYPDTFIRVRLHRLVAPEYLVSVWNSRLVRAQIESSAKTTAGIFKVSQGDLARVVVPVPSHREQIAIVELLKQRIGRMARIEPELESCRHRLGELDRAILAKAFRGELVPQDPNDEPASVLLERLRAEREQNGKPTNGAGRRRAAVSPPPAASSPAERGRKPSASRRGQAPARSRG